MNCHLLSLAMDVMRPCARHSDQGLHPANLAVECIEIRRGSLFGRPRGADERRRVFPEPAASQGGETRL